MKKERCFEAYQFLKDKVFKTPLINAYKINPNLYLKCENLQIAGSFKIRGALFCISELYKTKKVEHVICASAGNHAQGVASAAAKFNIPATVVMPITAPLSKIQATKDLGANVVLYGEDFNSAYEHAQYLKNELNADFIEPFDDKNIIAGQSSIVYELLEQIGEFDTIFVPIGGGGLISGISYVLKEVLGKKVKVIGVESEYVTSMKQALCYNKPIKVDSKKTLADGIAVQKVGALNLDICRKYIDQLMEVSELEITQSILTLIEKTKLVAEGAGVSALAAYLYQYQAKANEKVVVLISGGNIDSNVLEKIFDIALRHSYRKMSLEVDIKDKVGELAKLLSIFEQNQANIVSITHHRNQDTLFNFDAKVNVELETLDLDHQISLKQLLDEKKYNYRVLNES